VGGRQERRLFVAGPVEKIHVSEPNHGPAWRGLMAFLRAQCSIASDAAGERFRTRLIITKRIKSDFRFCCLGRLRNFYGV
jgi:hypothetical protein